MRTPFNFQRKAVRKLHHFGGRALLADDMGLGKTFESLLYVKEIEEYPVLVICPASMKYHWEREALSGIGVRALVLSGRKPFRSTAKLRHKMVIINYDILIHWLPWLLKRRFKVVILDECHKLGNRSNKWTVATRELCKAPKLRILGLSGTPVKNRPAELFSFLNIIRPDIYKSYFAFGFKYCEPRKRPWGWEFKGANNLDELHSELNRVCMIRRRKEDVLDELPAKTRIVIPLEIPDSARKEYREAEADFLNWLRKKAPHLARKAKKAQRLVQFGYLRRLVAAAKLDACIQWIDEFLEESDEKLIFFGIHKSFLGPLKARYKKVCTFIDGSVTGKKRQQAVDRFTKSSKVRIMIGNIDAAGTGWNGTAASAVAMGEIAWNPANMIQAEDRPHRIGQKKAVMAYWFVVRDSVEEDLCMMQQEKQGIFNAIMDGKKKRVDTVDVFDKLESALKERVRGKAIPKKAIKATAGKKDKGNHSRNGHRKGKRKGAK